MLEVIAVIFLSREIGKLALAKGVKASTWKIYFIVGWLVLEIIGIRVGFMIFDKNNFISIGLLAVAFGVTSYFVTRAQLNRLPDADGEIDHTGKN